MEYLMEWFLQPFFQGLIDGDSVLKLLWRVNVDINSGSQANKFYIQLN